MLTEFSIHLREVSKTFEIYHQPSDRLKQILFGKRRKFYDEYCALKAVNLTVRYGETIGIIGRNGAGKSTLLKLICKTLQPTCGTVEVRGRVAALLELGFGFNPEFSGRDNVYLSASLLGMSQSQINERYPQIEAFAGIGDFINQPVKLYSSGMYARLAFAVAAHVDADILIVDEILAVGDAAFTQKCMRYIRQFKQHGTILLVSHDVGAIVNFCDRAVWLDNGIVREIGPAKDVCDSYIASLYQSKDSSKAFRIGGHRKPLPEVAKLQRDVRADLLENSHIRNDIQLFDFDPDSHWFGERGATITDVKFLDSNGEVLTSLQGGQEVLLQINCEVHKEITRPIIGFMVKDRLGQSLFGDNTFLSYCDQYISVPERQSITTTFRFQLPYMPIGDYSVNVAISEGTQADHKQHHFFDDAFYFKVLSTHIARGLVGVPMLDINMTIGADQAAKLSAR